MHGRDLRRRDRLDASSTKPETLLPALGDTVRQLNQLFAPGARGAVRRRLRRRAARRPRRRRPGAPVRERPARARWRRCRCASAWPSTGAAEDAFVAAWHADRLVQYSGTGEAGDLLLNAYCAPARPPRARAQRRRVGGGAHSAPPRDAGRGGRRARDRRATSSTSCSTAGHWQRGRRRRRHDRRLPRHASA